MSFFELIETDLSMDYITKYNKFVHKFIEEFQNFSLNYPNKGFPESPLSSDDPYLNMLAQLNMSTFLNIHENLHLEGTKNKNIQSFQNVKTIFSPISPVSVVQFKSRQPIFYPKKTAISIVKQNNIENKTSNKKKFFDNPIYHQPHTSLKTCYDVHVLPIQLKRLKIIENLITGSDFSQSIFMDIKNTQEKPMTFQEFSCQEIIFYINERLETAFLLYDLIFENTEKISITFKNSHKDEIVTVEFDESLLQPLGFQADELAHDVSWECPPYISLLKDYFYFQNKFMFFKLKFPKEICDIQFTSFELTIFLGRNKKLNFNLLSNSLLLFCTPVIYRQEERLSVIPLKKGQLNLQVGGRAHEFEGLYLNSAKIVNSNSQIHNLVEKEEITDQREYISPLFNHKNKSPCFPYFQNTTAHTSSLYLKLTKQSPSFIEDNCNLVVNVKCFPTTIAEFNHSPMLNEQNAETTLTTMLNPMARRDMKNIHLKISDYMHTLMYEPFCIHDIKSLKNISTILDFSHDAEDFETHVSHRFLNLIESIKIKYEFVENLNITTEDKIQKIILLSLHQEKFKGLSLSLFATFIKYLDKFSSLQNRCLTKVLVETK